MFGSRSECAEANEKRAAYQQARALGLGACSARAFGDAYASTTCRGALTTSQRIIGTFSALAECDLLAPAGSGLGALGAGVAGVLLGALGALLGGLTGLPLSLLLDPLSVLAALDAGVALTSTTLASAWVSWLGVELAVILLDLLDLA